MKIPQNYRDLREFVAFLEGQGELHRVKVPVSPILELTEIVDRCSRGRGPNQALFFERVEGSSMPVVINTFGSARRMAWALGVEDLDEIRQRVARMIQPEVPGSFLEKVRKLGELSEVVRYRPRVVRHAPVQEVVKTGSEVNLFELPIPQCWPGDGGRYITLTCVISHDPVTGKRNVGMYRLQVYDERTTGMHWQIHKGGAAHYRRALEAGKRIPVAVALGGDPATIYSASAPLPPDIDEFLLAGWLRRKPVELVPAVTQEVLVPAHAEIVLEGYVEPGELRTEGPFGDHTGYYSLPEPYPVFHVTAITHRKDPWYPSILVGKPPQEDYWLGKVTERLFLPLVQLIVPEVVDMNMPAEGVFHNLVIVSVRKEYPGQVRKVMYALWGLMLLSLSKAIVVVDEDVNVHNLSEVAWHVLNNVDPKRDFVLVEGPLDALDHSADRPLYGSKVGIDATRKRPDLDGFPREWPDEIRMSPEIQALVERRWKEYGFR